MILNNTEESGISAMQKTRVLLAAFLPSLLCDICICTTTFPPILHKCPLKPHIHPCMCLEVPRSQSDARNESDIEIVAFCKTIRNVEVLQSAMKGFQHHEVDYFVMDGCKLPPFPNGLFHNIKINWIEILNSTIQFQDSFLSCAKDCI
ncbi:uncharacterized protein LOC143238530 [Tachypleus tridentatus]|uniref:uncharacterized protein LOC143238530 n=1 Tax=Tachypleus tridentatus TaxID=6853 RepID=UPI003FD31845